MNKSPLLGESVLGKSVEIGRGRIGIDSIIEGRFRAAFFRVRYPI